MENEKRHAFAAVLARSFIQSYLKVLGADEAIAAHITELTIFAAEKDDIGVILRFFNDHHDNAKDNAILDEVVDHVVSDLKAHERRHSVHLRLH